MNAFAPYYGEFLMLMLPHLAAMMVPGADFTLVAGQSVRFGSCEILLLFLHCAWHGQDEAPLPKRYASCRA